MAHPPGGITQSQRAALDAGREIRHIVRRDIGTNAHHATRVFRDAVAAIEKDGSSCAYFERVSREQPKAFLAFLGKAVGRLLPVDGQGSALELDAERVLDAADVRAELLTRGLPPTIFPQEADHERERLIVERQIAEERAKEAEKQRDIAVSEVYAVPQYPPRR